MVAALLLLVAFVEHTLRMLGLIVRVLIVAMIAAALGRASGLLEPATLPAFWTAIGAGLLLVAGPAWAIGYDSRVDEEYTNTIERARAQRDSSRRS